MHLRRKTPKLFFCHAHSIYLAQETNGPTTQYERPGTYPEAVKDFEALNPDKVRVLPGSNPGKHGILPDGRDVIVRLKSSKAGHPTLEIQNKPYRDKIKFRYIGDKYKK